jgi:hypothetical protein
MYDSTSFFRFCVFYFLCARPDIWNHIYINIYIGQCYSIPWVWNIIPYPTSLRIPPECSPRGSARNQGPVFASLMKGPPLAAWFFSLGGVRADRWGRGVCTETWQVWAPVLFYGETLQSNLYRVAMVLVILLFQWLCFYFKKINASVTWH